jgi:hypothetical protein
VSNRYIHRYSHGVVYWWLILSCGPVDAVRDTGATEPLAQGDRQGDGPTPQDTAVVFDDTGTAPPLSQIAIAGGSVWDRYLSEPLTLSVDMAGPGVPELAIVDAAGDAVASLDGPDGDGTVQWNGLLDSGEIVEVGSYTITGDLIEGGAVLASATHPLEVVRVGVLQGVFTGPKVSLVWHRMDGPGTYFAPDSDEPNFRIDHIDADGQARSIPAVWDDLNAPPDATVDHNTPAAYIYDQSPTLDLTVDGDLFDQVIDVGIEGWTTDDGQMAPGATIRFERDGALADGPSVVEQTLVLTYTSNGTAFATTEIPIRLYALLDTPGWGSTDVRYLPWLAAIDPALRAIEGAEPNVDAVTNALVAFIYRDLGLSYDTRWGASAYVSYSGRSFNNAHFDMSSFLERRHGATINCSDAAAILQAYANMAGVDLDYAIITPGFDLNYIKAIGGDDFTHCPFGGGGCGFSYHAVTTTDEAATIFDATLALDGDDNPSGAPHTELLVQSIDGEEYRERLVMSGSPDYRYIQKGTIQ